MTRYETTDQYFEDQSGRIAELLARLRAFIHEQLPEATEAMQYGVPVFRNRYGVPILYLFGSSAHVNFGFLRYDVLSDTQGVLKGSGKPSKHMEISPDQVIDTKTLGHFIAQCAQVSSQSAARQPLPETVHRN